MYTDAKRDYFKTEALYITEKDAEHDANIIARYVEKLGIEVVTFPGNENIIENLKNYKPDMVINLVDSVRGNDYLAATIPAILAFLKIPYTGTDLFGLALNNIDKYLTKQILQKYGVPVPNHQLFINYYEPIDMTLRFPLISKLNQTHCAVEIHDNSISENEPELRERLKFLINTYQQPIIVEEYIPGREFTAIFLEGLNKKVYFGEKVFNKPNQKYVIATFEDQWMGSAETPKEEWPYHYEKYEDPTLKEIIKKAAEVIKTFDYGKFDIRMDAAGRYYVIDANANPAFGPTEVQTAIAYILEMYGISFTEILRRIMINTIRESAVTEKKISVTETDDYVEENIKIQNSIAKT